MDFHMESNFDLAISRISSLREICQGQKNNKKRRFIKR